MKRNETICNDRDGVFVVVPAHLLDEIREAQNKILKILESKPGESTIAGYISENEAKKKLNRKTTWFWDQRSKGKLAYTKVGSQIFYRLADIENLLDSNRKESH